MCGICAIINLDQQLVRESPIREMMRIMKHRGPDDEGVFVEKNVGLGFVRLSIIDLSHAGHQPMTSADGRYVIVLNGEIYNYIELREELSALGHVFRTRTDTEVLLAAYREWGGDCLDRLNGMWAFAIYDRRERTLFCARDRFGVKPFYYHLDEDRLAFASEIPPLLQLLPGKPRANETAIYDYLVFNRTDQGEGTFFQEIKKLQHGNSMTIQLTEDRGQKSEVRINRWYDLKANLKEPFRTHGEFRETFSSAIGLRLRSDVPVGVCLSGGLDSSSIVSILLKDHQKKDLNTFSAVYGRGIPGDESEYIDLYRNEPLRMHFTTPSAQSLHLDLHRFVRSMGEPVPTTSPYAQFKVMELAKGKVVVTLDGQGADEQLAGYHYFFGFSFKELLRTGHWLKFGSELLHYLALHRSLFGMKTLLYFMLPGSLRGWVREQSNEYLGRDFADRNRKRSTFSDDLYGSSSLQESLLNHFEYKLEHLLKWEDRNSMAFSLEARVPFLDYRLVERTLSLPSDRIIFKGMNKFLLREAMSGTLHEKIRCRRDKIGFDTPMNEWFQNKSLKDFISQQLRSSDFLRELVDVKKVLNEYSRRAGGKQSNSREIWKILNLHLWHERFCQGSLKGDPVN